MQIELTDQEIEIIGNALGHANDAAQRFCSPDSLANDEYAVFKALRLKIDGALLIGAMEEK